MTTLVERAPVRSAPPRRRVWGVRPRLVVDVVLAVSFLALMSVTLTGLLIHEWLGVVLIVVVLVHLLAQWDWATSLTRGFLARIAPRVRINYILNWVLFVAAVLVFVSGILISQNVLAALHLTQGRSAIFGFWHQLHTLSAQAVIVLAALHVGLNWRWVVNAVGHLFR